MVWKSRDFKHLVPGHVSTLQHRRRTCCEVCFEASSRSGHGIQEKDQVHVTEVSKKGSRILQAGNCTVVLDRFKLNTMLGSGAYEHLPKILQLRFRGRIVYFER
jgi:hypothetical protein